MKKNKEHYFRMDFIQEVVKIDKERGMYTFIQTPDPKRYEWKDVNGENLLYDRLDDVYISEEVLKDMVSQMNGMPIYYQPQKIKDSAQYVKERIPFIIEELEGHFPEPTFEDKSEDFLNSLVEDELGFVILSLDIAKSTELATQLAPDVYNKIMAVIHFELSQVVPLFNGHVLKYTGDGFIAYFPEPSFITKNDLAFDCSLTLCRFVYEGINPILKKLGYPSIGIRIGLDSGDAYVSVIGHPNTKQHKDIIGLVVSLACKIQSTAEIGGICLGETTCRNLHTRYRTLCSEIDVPANWTYSKNDKEVYKIYKVNPGKISI